MDSLTLCSKERQEQRARIRKAVWDKFHNGGHTSADENFQIDSHARISAADGGYWVQCWLHVSDEEVEAV